MTTQVSQEATNDADVASNHTTSFTHETGKGVMALSTLREIGGTPQT